MKTRETITLDAKAQQRLLVLAHVLAGELAIADAAAYLRLSTRQVGRLADRLRTEGAAGLVHGNRGRQPANRVDEAVRASIAELARTTYAGFNPVHRAESLAETDPGTPSARTIRRILGAAGIASPRTRRPAAHRSRRERMPRAGMLVQADGSRHDWLEGRGPYLTLIAGIDDATGVVTGGTFRDHEDAAGYLEMLRRAVSACGRSGCARRSPLCTGSARSPGPRARGGQVRRPRGDRAGVCPTRRRRTPRGRPRRERRRAPPSRRGGRASPLRAGC